MTGRSSRLSSVRPPLGLYVEALATLIGASLAIRLVPFAKVAGWAVGRRYDRDERPGDAKAVRRVTLAWCRRVPWRALCMEQGVTAAHMLSRRGAAVELNYGAAMIGGNLEAHVWVRSAGQPVTGCENASDFVLLSHFSNGPSS